MQIKNFFVVPSFIYTIIPLIRLEYGFQSEYFIFYI